MGTTCSGRFVGQNIKSRERNSLSKNIMNVFNMFF
jgi:hypothetical protein